MRRSSPAVLLLSFALACGGGDAREDRDAASSKTDASVHDAATPDGPVADGGGPDGSMSAGGPPYDTLSETGLYIDIDTKQLAPGVVEYEPAYRLWSDGAIKSRWIQLPPDTQIDTSDMNHWRFPVGTKVWKEFRYEQDGIIRLETRLIERYGPQDDDVSMQAFVWRDDESDADFAELGATDVRGTDHDVPGIYDCDRCHGGEPGRVLGFSAVQLSHDGQGPTLSSLAADGLLTDPPPDGVTYPVPGDAVESAALGYLHANCGHCHQPDPAPTHQCYDLTELDLRVKVEETTVAQTGAFLTAVDQPLQYWTTEALGNHDGYTLRIDSGSPTTSAIYYRMSVRNALGTPPYDLDQQMPPIFTDVVDTAGTAAVQAWIESL